MKLSPKAQEIYNKVTDKLAKLGDLRNIAKEIKKDHELAMELWATGEFMPRLLATLIMDKKFLTQNEINRLDTDMQTHKEDEKLQLTDWLMANQLMKDKKTIALIESWADSPSALQRRTYWYYQGRLRWTGNNPADNTAYLLMAIEAKIENEAPEVQWAMNFTAGWIGVYEKQYRRQCVALGEKTGLYKDEMVSKGCTPSYLPEFIRIEAGKREK